MKFLVIDTETSDLFDFKKEADDPDQGRLAQLAMIRCGGPPDFEIEEQDGNPVFAGYVKPEGWRMSEGATATNGLTTSFLMTHGSPVRDLLDIYEQAIVSENRVVVAFHAQFDCKVMRGELRRAGRSDLFERTRQSCVMRASQNICQIPFPSGRGGYKWPNLSEAARHFGIKVVSSHKAQHDALVAYEIMKKINRLGLLPEPSVHRSKNWERT